MGRVVPAPGRWEVAGPAHVFRPAALLAILLLGGCGRAADRPPEVVAPPVGGLTTALHDRVRDLPDGRVGWSTEWELCWAAYPGARSYELQALTSEGAPRDRRGVAGRCFQIEVAAGETLPDSRVAARNRQLTVQSGQLSYRVRAVLDGSRVSEWSEAVAVGGDPGAG